ncbi:MAG: DUF4432 family protein [Clostridia bacterium]
MPTIHGVFLTKAQFLRLTGDPSQAFGIRPVLLTGGKEQLTQVLQVDLASGLSYQVCPSKGLDLIDLHYRGISLGFVSKAGLHSPFLADEQGLAYRYTLGAGFLYTAGLSNVGMYCEDEDNYHYAHGSLKNTPADNLCAQVAWRGDDCDARISGDVRDSAFFGRNLLLHREICAHIGDTRLTIRDTIENQSCEKEALMLLYHMNLGYPLLDEGARLLAPVERLAPMSEHTRKNDAAYDRMTAPEDGNQEYLYALTLAADAHGETGAALYNPRLGFGLYVRFPKQVLRRLIIWKCMRSGDYALGILPATCTPIGRTAARASGEIQTLAPYESLETRLEIGILENEHQAQCFCASLGIAW